MAKKWQAKMVKSVTVTTAKYPYKEPYLSKPDDDDLKKRWMVCYGVWSEKERTIKRKRVVLTELTVQARKAEAAEIIKDLRKLLRSGVCVDPIGQSKPAVEKTVDKNKIAPGSYLSDAIKDFLAYKEKSVSPNSFRTYRTSINVFVQYIADSNLKRMRLEEFGPGDALDFLDATIMRYGQSNRSHNNIRDVMLMFYRHYCNRINKSAGRVLMHNPFEDIDNKTTTARKHVPFNDEQRQLVMAECARMGNTYLLTFIRFIFYTFMRPHVELRLMRVKDILPRSIYVNPNNAKDNEAEHVEIAPPLERLIQELGLRDYPQTYYVFSKDGQPGPVPVGNTFFWRQHRDLLQHLGLTDRPYDLYSWKHTGVIALWTATQNIQLIKQHCRHSSAAMTEEYLRDLGIIVRDTQIQEFPEF